MENNNITISGKIVSDLELSHEVYNEKFYKFYIKSERLSNQEDILPVIISERMINLDELEENKNIRIDGQFRSYNEQRENGNKLVLSIFVKGIDFIPDDDSLTQNDANFIGYVCKNPIYRKTPLGREIADVLIAVNRTYKKSDYIPCILWGRNAKYCENLEVGTKVKVNGRIQSRNYEKKLDENNIIKKTAYEVSVSKFAVAE